MLLNMGKLKFTQFKTIRYYILVNFLFLSHFPATFYMVIKHHAYRPTPAERRKSF